MTPRMDPGSGLVATHTLCLPNFPQRLTEIDKCFNLKIHATLEAS